MGTEAKDLRRVLCLFLLLTLAPPAQSHQILFYYNHFDGTDGSILECVKVLQSAGHQVKTIDVAGKNRNPLGDDWAAFDQVWDMRFVDRDKEECGSGSPSAADYFDDHWRAKSISYLNHCGKLFLGGEHYQMADRDEGLYRFLKEVHAVKENYDPCAPSIRGNSTTDGVDFYPVKNGLGPVTFFGAYVGGIPLAQLTGTNFVDTREDWVNEDGVDRSIAAGWKGSQLGGSIRAPMSCRGKLFMVWDATMWTYWQPEFQVQVHPPHPWDENSWFPPNTEGNEERQMALEIQTGQSVTRKFFPAVARWLGNTACPCGPEAPMGYGVDQINTPVVITKAPVVQQPSPLVTSTASFAPKSQILFSNSKIPVLSAPETLQFEAVPINLYIRFRDGIGEYQLDLWNYQGQHIRLLYDAKVSTQKEAWASWDGLDEQGVRRAPGVYSAVLSKDGKFLRKVILSWTISSRNPK